MGSNGERGESLEQLLRDLGVVLTEEGRARWRERLSKPISPEALAEGRRMREEASRAAEATARATAGLSLDEILREAGFEITEEGKARWRERLSKPIPPHALAEGRRRAERARRGEAW